MKTLFKKAINAGVKPDMAIEMVDELRVMNSIKIHGVAFVWLVGFSLILLVSAHANLVAALMITHAAVCAAVIWLNKNNFYTTAKWTFVLDPAVMVVFLSAYFGLATNIHYLGLVCLVVFMVMFKRKAPEHAAILISYLLVLISGLAYIYVEDFHIVQLSTQGVDRMRLMVYVLTTGLSMMMGVILRQSTIRRSQKTKLHMAESERDSTILQTISRNMEEAIFKSNRAQGFSFVNQAFANMFGYASKEELLATHPVNLYTSKAERDALLARIDRQGKLSNQLMRYRRKDGSIFWGRLSCTQLNQNGEVFLVGTISDVTVQQEQTALLRENERQLKESQHLAKLGNWRVYPTTQSVEWSGECAKIHGFLTEDYPNPFEVWLTCIQDLSQDDFTNGIARSALMNKAFEFGSWYKTPGGEHKYLYYICRSDETQATPAWYGTVQDRTELKNQELELISTREFYQSVLDNIPVECVLINDELKYEYISKNAIGDETLRQWLIGKTDRDYADYRKLDSTFALERAEMCRKAIETGLTMRWEEKMKTRDGRDTYHLRNLAPIKLRFGQQMKAYLLGYSFDINDIKRAQFRLEERNEELNRLNKELDRFVYSISHDLRAPIASVLGLNALAEEAEDSEELNAILQMQSEALDRLDRYIRDVIDYSRNKRLDVSRDEVYLKKVIDESLANLTYMSNFSEIEFFIEVDEALVVHSDKMRIRIIFNNLFSNAIKYADTSKSNCYISVRAKREREGVLLEFEDNGIGIKEEYKTHIWDMFFRGTSDIPGSGLGLYILKESVKNLQGTITLDSTEGVGTTFKIYIPEIK